MLICQSKRLVIRRVSERRSRQDGITSTLQYQTNLEKIGSITVSSFQVGMEQEKMQDGSNRTFSHAVQADTGGATALRDLSPNRDRGLSYATWSGGNGNGQIKKFEIYASEDGEHWGDPIARGDLETRLANEQPIPFSVATNARFLKFLATQSYSIDGRSLASIGKLDVIVSLDVKPVRSEVSIASDRTENLRAAIRRFAKRAFSSNLSDAECNRILKS